MPATGIVFHSRMHNTTDFNSPINNDWLHHSRFLKLRMLCAAKLTLQMSQFKLLIIYSYCRKHSRNSHLVLILMLCM